MVYTAEAGDKLEHSGNLGGIQLLLPMSESTLQALLWDAISVGASLLVLKGLVNAVQSRHGHYRLQKPVGDQGGYQRLTKALACFQGTQHRHVFPNHRALMVRLLQYTPEEHNECVCGGQDSGCRPCWRSLYEWRNALWVCHTIGCMRPDEGHNLKLCDWWPDYDARAGYTEFASGAALNISAQKNDAGRKGAHKRFGKAADPTLDFMDQMVPFKSMLQRASGWAKAALNATIQSSAAQCAHHCGLEGNVKASVFISPGSRQLT